MHKYCAFSFLLLLSLAPLASARTIGVPGDSPTIQAGIDASSPGDTVQVQPGRYIETIDFKGKDIVVGSLFLVTKDSSYIINTIIDADQKDTVVAFQNGETARAELAGFTITNGKGSATVSHGGLIGGGIYCKGASPFLHHLILENNFTQLEGGGMYLEVSNSSIEYCVIRNNRGASGGGGLYSYQGNNQIRNCIIDYNNGNGVTCYQSKVLFFRDLIINSKYDNGMALHNSDINILNCTFSNNPPPTLEIVYSNVNIINSILWENYQEIRITRGDNFELPTKNIVIAFCDIKGGQNNITNPSADSLYYDNSNIDSDPFLRNDFSLSNNSPCIDSGVAFYKIGDKVISDLTKDDYHGNAPDMGFSEINFTSAVISNDTNRMFKLSNYPNPFNSSTSIQFFLKIENYTILSIYDITGRKILDLLKKTLSSGNYKIQWNGNDKSGNKVSSGIYLIQLKVGVTSISKSIVFLK
jgi:hypothetical protein